ncbi:primosomal protein [Cellulosimicrobium terreum]|nr:primosomal protein [Cellulosimicrobium terreum]
MTADPRAALDRFVAALEAHHHAVASRRGEDDPAVDDAYDVLADAFEVYDESLGQVYGEETPFYLADDEDEDDEADEGAVDEGGLDDDGALDDDDRFDVVDDDALDDQLTGERAR